MRVPVEVVARAELSSTTSSPMRWRGQPPSPTSPFAAGATTNTRPSWSSALMVPRSSGRGAPVL